jgi:hypothetical protein
VKANNVVFPAFPEPVEGMSSTHYLIYRDNETGSYFLIKPLDPGIDDYGDRKVRLTDYYKMEFSTPAIIYTWRKGEGTWETYREIAAFKDYFPLDKYKVENGTIEFLYSSFNLHYGKYYNEGELFFQRAPIKANFLTQMKAVKMGAIMTTLASLIPLLTVLVISFLAFRKTWAWLLKVLCKA